MSRAGLGVALRTNAPVPPTLHPPGWSLGELLVTLNIVMLLLLLAQPSLATLDRARLRTAARRLSRLYTRCRLQAALDNRNVAIAFDERGGAWRYGIYGDTNGNGVSRRDVDRGIDEELQPPEGFASRFNRVSPKVLDLEEIPAVPNARGRLEGDDPIRFGRGDIVSFSPLGTSSSGTVYLSNRPDRMVAVKLYGLTGRIQLWEYRTESGRWERFDF